MKCPRCLREYTGYSAISRYDNKTKICTICGQVEALENLKGKVRNPKEVNNNGKKKKN